METTAITSSRALRSDAAETSAWYRFCNGLVQYFASAAAGLLVLAVFFPGNRFMPVPWQHDDFLFFSPPEHVSRGPGVELFCSRPVSLNIGWRLGMLGETPFYAGMFLLVASIPLLSVRLAMRLFRCRPGPALATLLTAGISACFFLFEQSLWWYRFGGLMTNLSSVILGLLATHAFSRSLDGRRIAFVGGFLLFFASAFAKEDMLLFVPLLVAIDWFVQHSRRDRAASGPIQDGQSAAAAESRMVSRNGNDSPPFSRLAAALGAMAFVVGLLFVWNRWIMPSPFTNNASAPYLLSFSATHIAGQIWRYMAASKITKIAFIALAAAGGIGMCRPRQRVAAAAMLLLPVAMILPYAILPRFFEYYSLNWLAMVLSLMAVCIAASCRDWLPRRLTGFVWLAPLAILVAIFAGNRSAAEFRLGFTNWINWRQGESQYVIEQLERHREELAGADTIAVRGADGFFSPWLLTTGAYANRKVGHEVHWFFVYDPQSIMAQYLAPSSSQGAITVVQDNDLPAHDYAATINFDKKLTMSVLRETKPMQTARAAGVAK